jgi:hypothetical protein
MSHICNAEAEVYLFQAGSGAHAGIYHANRAIKTRCMQLPGHMAPMESITHNFGWNVSKSYLEYIDVYGKVLSLLKMDYIHVCCI